MLPLTVVKYFNVFENALSGLFSRTIVLIINQFGFQGFEKGFCDRSSSAAESHPNALTQPYVSLSTHTALVIQL